MPPFFLLDERSRPDFRETYGRCASRAAFLDAAVRRVRLGGIDLTGPEIGGLERLRLLVGEVNALALSAEAEALAADPARRGRLLLLTELLSDSRLQVRIAPLAGWSPDFSVFRPHKTAKPVRGKTKEEPLAPTLMLGPHWFERPFPHPGPALSAVMTGDAALAALARFEEIWHRGHDLNGPIGNLLNDALERSPTPVPVGLTLSAGSEYSSGSDGPQVHVDPV